jgi:hypothetical protein
MITLGGCGMISLLRMMGMPRTVILSRLVLWKTTFQAAFKNDFGRFF